MTCSRSTVSPCSQEPSPRRPRRPVPRPSASAPRAGGSPSSRPRSRPGAAARPVGSRSPRPRRRRRSTPRAILGMDIKGHTVHQVMIAQGAQIDEEYYFSILLDRANRAYLAMCSKEGGMDIEQLAVERPEALARVPVDPNVGIDDAKAKRDRRAGGLRRRDRAQDRAGPAGRSGASTATRTPRSSRSTPWSRRPTGTSWRWTARSRSTRTPSSGIPSTSRSRTPPRPTRSRWPPRRRTSTTSSSTARSASSGTARGSS